MELPREVVEHVARLARIALSEEEIETFARQLGEVLVYMERLNQVDTDGVAPLSHVIELENVLREDVARPSLPAEDVFRNAPQPGGGLFKVPRVIDQEG
jgi:aspartyl-tRNA(Asn)/glutamyl-tRNA(Gln) amidotransferase subunit C